MKSLLTSFLLNSVSCIDTPLFQRLRSVKLLGCLDRICPSATTTIFENSIGTFNLVNKLIQNLSYKNPDPLSDFDKDSLLYASLFSKLNATPYESAFIPFFIERYGPLDQKNILNNAIDSLVDTNNLDISANLVKESKSLLNCQGETWKSLLLNNQFTHSGLDDFDFLNRAMYKLSIDRLSLDISVITNNIRVLDGKLCYNSKDIYSLYEFYQLKYKLNRNYVCHRVKMGIDLMLADILFEESTVRDFREVVNNIEEFKVLDDYDFEYLKVRF